MKQCIPFFTDSKEALYSISTCKLGVQPPLNCMQITLLAHKGKPAVEEQYVDIVFYSQKVLFRMTAPSVIPRAVQPCGQMLIPPTERAGNEGEWDRGQEQTPIKAVKYRWQPEHTEQLINSF